MKTKDLKKKLLAKPKKEGKIPLTDFVSTGSTLLNLACSGKINGGFPKGFYILIVGDSSSGKTFFAMTCLAEANVNEEFNDYRFIFDNAERGSTNNYSKYFGANTVERIEPPRGDRKNPDCSSTLEDFYANINRAFKVGLPFIYILDSMDALQPKEEIDEEDKRSEAVYEGKAAEEKGTYGTKKARMNQRLRIISNRLKQTGSILIIISQAKDNIGFGSQFNPKARSGGTAMRYYTRLELWTSVMKSLSTKVHGVERAIGKVTRVSIKKNHINGWEGDYVTVPHYRSTGFDDLGGCVDFLVEEKVWTESAKKINTKGFVPNSMKREALVAYIENKGLEKKLKLLVRDTWNEIEEKSSIKRKKRYV